MTAGHPHLRNHDWAAREVTGGRVLLVGAGLGSAIAAQLAAAGRAVVAVAPSPSDPWAMTTLLAGDEVANTAAPAGFDSVVLVDIFADRSTARSILEDAVRYAAPGAQIVVTAPYGEPPDRTSLPLDLVAFTALLRPVCSPVRLTVLDLGIRFVGRVGPPADAWNDYDAAGLLAMTEQAGRTVQGQLDRRIESLQREALRLRASGSYRAGRLLLDAVRAPSSMARFPGELRRLLATRPSRAGAGPAALTDQELVEPLPAADPPEQPLVATIVAAATATRLQYDVSLYRLSRRHWREELAGRPPAMLLVEACPGADLGPWTAPVAGAAAPDEELVALLEACRARSVPVILWETAGPAETDEAVGVAPLFDVVFTADPASIPRYQAACGHDRVFALPVAIQPAIHNPHRPRGTPDHAVGSLACPSRVDPAPTLSHQRASYRTHRVLRIPAPGATCSQHVLESVACGTPVVGDVSAELQTLLGAAVRVARTPAEADREVQALLTDDEQRRRVAHGGYRLLHERYTERHRLTEVFTRTGLEPGSPVEPAVSVILATSRPGAIATALQSYARQAHANRELWLVLNNNEFDLAEAERLVAGLPNANVVRIEGRTTLGASINQVLDRCAGQYVAKMDDDDHYGERYLGDLVLAARFSGAEIVGKARYFTYLERTDELGERLLGPEHDDADLVSGATLLIKRDLFRTLRFAAVRQGTDTLFLQDALAAGCRIYSADKYNFALFRRPDPRQHTWQIAEEEFRRKCVDLRPGFDLSRLTA